MRRPILSLLCAAVAVVLAGCESASSSASRPVYPASQTGQVISGDGGMVMAVEEVLIQAPSANAGSAGTGAQVGRAVGSAVLTGNPVGIVGSLGGIMGAKAGATMDNQIGDKVTILLDTGKTVVVVQVRDRQQPIMPGERVIVEQGSAISTAGGGNARVIREQPAKDSDNSKPIGTRDWWART